jgi:aminoglycoside phosphotransferase (APT) family kinase protein
MESLTKIRITPEDLDRAARAAFGVGVVSSTELADGWFNTIHAVELADGRLAVLKVAPRAGVPVLRYEANLLATEVAVLDLLKNVPGVRVPQMLAYDPAGAWLGLPAFFMERFPFPTLASLQDQLEPAMKAKLERDLGHVNRALSEVRGPAFGLVGGARFRRWSDAVLALVTDVLSDAADIGTNLPVAEEVVTALVEARREVLDLVTEPRLVHWDLHGGNAFVDAGRIAGIIDADRALFGDPLMEVYFGTLFDRTSFVEGFGAEFLDRPGTAERRLVYDLYLALVMLVESDFRRFDEGHKAWARGQLETAISRLGPTAV